MDGCRCALRLSLALLVRPQELEEHAEAQVVTLLRHVDAALYASAAPAASPSPVPSPSAAATAAGPVRFPHRKPLLSYMDECAQWSAAFPHFRVDGVSCGPPLITAIPIIATADTASHSSKRQSGRAARKAAALVAQMGHAMPPSDAATAAAAAASIAASSTAAVVPPVLADPASLSLRGSAIAIANLPHAAPTSEDAGSEILYIDGAGFEETLALDHSGDLGDVNASLLSLDLDSAASAYSSAHLKSEHRGMPPLTPSRLAEWEQREAAKEKVWHDRTLGSGGAGCQQLIRAIVTILSQAREKHANAVAEAAKLAPSSPSASLPQDEGDADDVLFFDGDQSMPNPFLATATAAHATSCSPRTAQLRALLGLDAAGNFKPAPPPRAPAAAEAEADSGMVRIRMHSASASASARSRRKKQQQMALAFADSDHDDDSDTELASTSFTSAAPVGSGSDPFAAADAVGPVHKKSRAALGFAVSVAAASNDDDADEASSFADPLSYRSPSVYSAYSLTHSSRRSRSALHGGAPQGLTPNAHMASRDNPLSRSSSRVGATTAASGAQPRASFESFGWPEMPRAVSPDSPGSEKAECEHSRGESVVAPMPLPQPPTAGASRSSPMSPPRRTRPAAAAASPPTGGRNITPPLQQEVASPTRMAVPRSVDAPPQSQHRPSSSAAPFRPSSSRHGTSSSPTGAVAANGSAAASPSNHSPAAASTSGSSPLSPQGRRVTTAASSASKQKRATVPASLPFNLVLIAKQNALQQQHASASNGTGVAPPASATASSAQVHSAAAVANSLRSISSPPPLPPSRSGKVSAGTTLLPALRLPSLSTASGGSSALGQMQRPHTVQSTRSGQPSMTAGLANGSSGGLHAQSPNQDASARSVQAPSRRLAHTTQASADSGVRSQHVPVYLNSTLPPHAALPPSSHQHPHPHPLRVPRAVSALPRSSHAHTHTLVQALSSTQQPGKRIGVPSSFGSSSNQSRATEEKAKEVSLLRASTPVAGGGGAGHERRISNGSLSSGMSGGEGGGGFDAYLQRPFSSSSIRAAAHAQLHGSSLGVGFGAGGSKNYPHPDSLSSAASSSSRSVAASSGSSVTVSSTHGLVRGSHGFGVNPSAQGAAAAAKAHLAAAQAVYAAASSASSSQHGNRSAMHSPVQPAPPSRTHSMTGGGLSSGSARASAKKKAIGGGLPQPQAPQIAPHRPHGMAPPALSTPKNKSALAARVPTHPNPLKPSATAT